MCGIWAYLLNNDTKINDDIVYKNFMNIKGRGPDNLNLSYYDKKYIIGFHRLSIIDNSSKGSQPFEYYDNNIKYTCICNGEIYNAEYIKNNIINDLGYNFTSNSDCEVLIPLFMKYKENMLEYLDGVFAIIIIKENDDNIEYFIARDRFGIRPIYYGKDLQNNYIFSSELKGIKDIAITAKQFKPGHYIKLNNNTNTCSVLDDSICYYDIEQKIANLPISYDVDTILQTIKDKLISSVKKRLIADRPVCALLSGGLDSSLVCSIASQLLKEKGTKLYTFSIGIPGSPDNEFAQIVADYIGSEHTIIHISPDDAINSLKNVIQAVETYDITTIRASTGQYLVSKYISENTDFKVILSGDGSDEVTSGYLENFLAPNNIELHQHALDRIKNIHYYDVQRADRATSMHGLEIRVPFLDAEFVEYYLTIDSKLRMPKKNSQCEKYLLRKAFINYLPENVLWRQKEAFSDGISAKDNSWYTIIQDVCNKLYTNDMINYDKYEYNKPISKESYYFRELFTELYGNEFSDIIPGFWMPKWSKTNDPSARTLEAYQ